MASNSQLDALAEDAAQQLFHARNADALSVYEPTGLPAAQAAVRRLSQLFEGLPGAIAEALDAARNSGDLLSSDNLQGIAEIIQNADDVDAKQVRLFIGPTDLWVGHDGSPVRLRHVLGLATPWLSTKGSQADTNGRFGIGLMTLRSLSDTLDIHCHPYHVRLGEPTLSFVDPPTPPSGLDETGWTILRVPLDRRSVSQRELEEWLDRWDDSALIFLRSVTKVTLLDSDGASARELAISRHDAVDLQSPDQNASTTVSRQRVEAADGRSWIVYNENAPTPSGVSRTRKATLETTPVAVALPLYPVVVGQIHAGLPVARTRLTLFANAQFDPLASRRDFSDNEWNVSLISLVAKLWSQAALDLFGLDPETAWHAMPVPGVAEGPNASLFIGRLEDAVIASARERVAGKLTFLMPEGDELSLSQLALEAKPLEQILTATETASLAGLPATLPLRVRDPAGRWRQVLNDWRGAGASVPEWVSVEQALSLLGDDTRSPLNTISLVAAGLEAGLGHRLLNLPCIIAKDGRHVVPPRGDSPEAVAASATTLAEQLGVVTLLHSAHFGDGIAARTVLRWLREMGALLEESDDRLVVRRLAAAGQAGRQVETPLTDEQVIALRTAFERMDLAELQELAPYVGSAISLEGFQYEVKGRKKIRKFMAARPIDAYLPSAVDRESDSFAFAAKQSLGILWLSGHYARILRSPSGREGIGAQRFLRLLGAETAPRLRLHPQLTQRYDNDQRLGLSKWVVGGSSNRMQALADLDATYTLHDRDSPALAAVIRDISRIRRDRQERRRRAAALLASMARGWERLLGEFTDVDAVSDYHRWRERGRISAYWLWAARDVAWLDDESGTPRRPSELRVRTPSTVAIYGNHSPDYLHPELYQQNWRTVLAALGVSGDPSRAELVDRLKELRDGFAHDYEITTEELKQEAAVVYKALAHSLSTANVAFTNSRTDLNQDRIRREFQQGIGLVFSNLGWLPPQSVLAGSPIFDQYKAFAPAISDTEQLWTTLRLRQPSFEDCVDVLRTIARKRGPLGSLDETVMLETMRALASHKSTISNPQARAKLRNLPLWTSLGWRRSRPVFATDDPVLAAGLKDRLPLWQPGGELQQFRPILDALRVEEVGANSEVIDPGLAAEDEGLSDHYKSALQQLQDDLARNDPQLATSVRVPWEVLKAFSVHVHPSLSVGVSAGREGAEVFHECKVAATVDQHQGIFYIQDPTELSRVDSGGRAIAALFDKDPRRVAQAWRAACDQAESGRTARVIELAEQRTHREQGETEQGIEERTAKLRDVIATKHQDHQHAQARSGNASSSPAQARERANAGSALTGVSHRVLVDPDSLTLIDTKGKLQKQVPGPHSKITGGGRLAAPRQATDGPQGKVSIRLYTDLDRETVGLNLLRKVLVSDSEEIKDLRAQRGVGADAIDELGQFYELKVSSGTEPDQVTLTNAEVKRALTTPNFFLVVVSGVEGVDAKPKVRVIIDPLSQLQPAESGAITLSGVRSATSLTYDFNHIDSPSLDGEDEQLKVQAIHR